MECCGLGQKVELQQRIREKLDIACIQETHLHPDQCFSVCVYQTFRHDSEGRRKGHMLTLVKTDIEATETVINTEGEAFVAASGVHPEESSSTDSELLLSTIQSLLPPIERWKLNNLR